MFYVFFLMCFSSLLAEQAMESAKTPKIAALMHGSSMSSAVEKVRASAATIKGKLKDLKTAAALIRTLNHLQRGPTQLKSGRVRRVLGKEIAPFTHQLKAKTILIHWRRPFDKNGRTLLGCKIKAAVIGYGQSEFHYDIEAQSKEACCRQVCQHYNESYHPSVATKKMSDKAPHAHGTFFTEYCPCIKVNGVK